MMPTTREASTPSRSAISRAESTKTPVVNHLQLQIKCTASRDFRQPDQSSPICPRCLGYPILMLMRTFRPSTAALLSLLLCGQAPSQAPPSTPLQGTAVHPDPKRAQKAAERGDKSEAAGHFDEALADVAEPAPYPPHPA